MPGLLRGVARTAVVAGTASAVSGRVQRRQARKFAESDAQTAADRNAAYQNAAYQNAAYQDQPADEPRSAPGTSDKLDQLRQLGELKQQGVLTEEEFAAEKAKILGR